MRIRVKNSDHWDFNHFFVWGNFDFVTIFFFRSLLQFSNFVNFTLKRDSWLNNRIAQLCSAVKTGKKMWITTINWTKISVFNFSTINMEHWIPENLSFVSFFVFRTAIHSRFFTYHLSPKWCENDKKRFNFDKNQQNPHEWNEKRKKKLWKLVKKFLSRVGALRPFQKVSFASTRISSHSKTWQMNFFFDCQASQNEIKILKFSEMEDFKTNKIWLLKSDLIFYWQIAVKIVNKWLSADARNCIKLSLK